MTKKRKSQDAMDHLAKERPKWLLVAFEDEEGECADLALDYIHKTKFGLWKEIDAADLGLADEKDPYLEGANHLCPHCNTSYQTHFKDARCPFCHKRPL